MMNLRDNALGQPHKSSGSSVRVAITRKAIPLHELLGGTNEALILKTSVSGVQFVCGSGRLRYSMD